jgi:DNA polymerase
MLSIYGVEVDDIGAKTIEPLLDTELHPVARKLITDRLGVSKTSTKKLKRAIASDMGDHRLRGMHTYFGAHTGRFSGALLQVQNLVRDCVKDIDGSFALLDMLPDEPSDAIAVLGGPDKALAFASSMIRPCLLATKAGRVLVARDFNSIEARMLAWLAGAVRLLALYRAKEDPYRYMAERIFGIPYAKIAKDSFERFVGKQTVLGAGYGMGWPRFISHCSDAGQLVSDEQAQTAIKGYRDGAPEIPALWREIEEAVDEVMEDTRGGVGRYCAGGKLIFFKTVSNGIVTSLRCRLPNGRIMVWIYPAYVQTPGRDGEGKRQLTYLSHAGDSASVYNVIVKQCAEHKLNPAYYLGMLKKHVAVDGWTRVTIWGGTFTENIIQALSRDVLVEAMLRVARAGHEVVLHVHDELVVEAAQEHAPHIHQLMEMKPEWCPDAMLEVEGWEGTRYRK